MKSFRLLLIMAFLVGLVSIAVAQETISPEDAAKFIGQQKTVCGTAPVLILQPSQRGSRPLSTSTNLIPTRYSLCLFGDRTGASLKSRPKRSIPERRFA